MIIFLVFIPKEFRYLIQFSENFYRVIAVIMLKKLAAERTRKERELAAKRAPKEKPKEEIQQKPLVTKLEENSRSNQVVQAVVQAVFQPF
jgi:hypothetical protein